MKLKLLALVAVITAVVSCGKDDYNSHNNPAKGATVTIANSLSVTTKLNSVNSFVNVVATVYVYAVNANTYEMTPYSNKTQQFTADQWGTPGHLDVKNVNVPNKGPHMIQVVLETYDCNAFAQNCSPVTGGKQKFSQSQTFSNTGAAPNNYMMNKLDFVGS